MYSHVVYAFGYRGFPPIFAFVRPLIDQVKILHFSGFERHNFLVLHNSHKKETVDVLEYRFINIAFLLYAKKGFDYQYTLR